MSKRVFIVVIDSMGIGEMPDAAKWGDEGSNTLATIRKSDKFNCPNLTKLGLMNIDTVGGGTECPEGVYGRLTEVSMGKDTTTGHWEIAGLISENPMPTFPDGFPVDFMEAYSKACGYKLLANKVYSGTEVIKDYGKQQIDEKALIIYTSADSVFQIAAHEDVVPVPELYRCCEIARRMLTGPLGVGRVIARPFTGEWPYKRTANRHDYSLLPPKDTMLDLLMKKGYATISVGKIFDIFAGKGCSESNRTVSNADGMQQSTQIAGRDFEGLCFINLVETDSTFGHRNDIDGYANAVSEIDKWLGEFIQVLRDEDMLIVTADHGCDPGTPSTDHSREYVPVVVYGPYVKKGVNLGTRNSFADISATVLDYFGVPQEKTAGESFKSLIWE